MEAEFKSHEGCELLLSTRGRALKMEDGRVAGIYATTSDGGVLEIDAPAVILAGGGYGGSLEEVAKRFWRMPVGRYSCDGALTNVGDGINMVIAAGGVDDSAHNSFNGLVMGDTPNRAFGLYAVDPKTMWVNQDGERIVDESACKGLPSLPAMNLLFQHNEIYSIFDAAMMGDALEDAKVEAVDSPTGVFYADSIDDLAAQINIDAEALAASIANYNALIEAGVDTDFGKDLTGLAPISEPPFFAFRQILSAHGTVGGIVVDLKYEVIRPDGSPIPGLYAVGMESNMNYRKFAYSFAISGGAMGQAVDSGR
ncbi:MAG: FAD-binding protein [Coriobacteriales bacterium]|nr:FAD-binding protein [Coriobacteriales bacterium]